MGDILPATVTVILPARNEEEEILVVDGNSSDKTRELALKKGARVHLEDRRGYGRAYRTGFDIASHDIIVTMDADCTYPAELVPK